MKILLNVACIIGVAALSMAPVLAKNEGKLPKGAVPLSAEDAKAMFLGNTIDWKPARVYWNPDGTALGYNSEKGKEYVGEGTWTANGNEVCYDMKWRGGDLKVPYPESVCDQLFRVGKQIWTKNTKNSEDKYFGDIYSGMDKKFLKGDKITKKANALKVKLGD